MMFEILLSKIPGCFELRPKMFEDVRGRFVKTFHKDFFLQHGLNTEWREEYYSTSSQGVLRGLHFQLPPHDHEKLVYCSHGEVLDAVVDLRVGSPTYGQYALFRLNSEEANMVYVPRGLAHGFFTLSKIATMMYKVASVYASQHDSGILWNSAGIEWPEKLPILSVRDAGFKKLADFESPFVYEAKVRS